MNPLVTNVYLEVRSLFLKILLKAQDVFRQIGTDSMCSDSSHILSLNLNKDTWCYQSRNVFLFSFFFKRVEIKNMLWPFMHDAAQIL